MLNMLLQVFVIPRALNQEEVFGLSVYISVQIHIAFFVGFITKQVGEGTAPLTMHTARAILQNMIPISAT